MNHHQQIEQLLYLYAERIDLGDFKAVADLFRHASIVDPGGSTVAKGFEQVLTLYQQSTRIYDDNHTPHTQHVTTNIIIDVEPQGQTATARSCFTVFQSLPDFPLQAIIAGRYHDTFEQVEQHWRFTKRVMRPELLGDLSRHLLANLPDNL